MELSGIGINKKELTPCLDNIMPLDYVHSVDVMIHSTL